MLRGARARNAKEVGGRHAIPARENFTWGGDFEKRATRRLARDARCTLRGSKGEKARVHTLALCFLFSAGVLGNYAAYAAACYYAGKAITNRHRHAASLLYLSLPLSLSLFICFRRCGKSLGITRVPLAFPLPLFSLPLRELVSQRVL